MWNVPLSWRQELERECGPVTLDTPKPLIRVNGVRMIDTVIRALQENGILRFMW